jgi:hypothetical protein
MSTLHPLLIEAAPGRHIVQLSESQTASFSAAHAFVREGLIRGEAVVAIITPQVSHSIVEQLSADEQLGSGRRALNFQIMDADTMLFRILVNRMPDLDAFERNVGQALEAVRARGAQIIRIVGGMVDILWHDGRVNAAVQLEAYGKRLASRERVAVLCTFCLNPFDLDTYTAPLEEVAELHSDVLVAEDERFFHALRDGTEQVTGMQLENLTRAWTEARDRRWVLRSHDAIRSLSLLARGKVTEILEVARRGYAAN